MNLSLQRDILSCDIRFRHKILLAASAKHIYTSDIFFEQSDAVASGLMLWIGPLISSETGRKKGKLPELAGFIGEKSSTISDMKIEGES